MKWFACYDSIGRIVQTGTVPNVDIDRAQGPAGTTVYKGVADPSKHYIDLATGERQDREPLPYLLTVNTGQAIITTLPSPCIVRVLGEEHEITDGVAEINFDAPGTYTVELRSRPRYLDEVLELDIP